MKAVLKAFALALGDLRTPRILAVAVTPVLAALLLWCGALWLFWHSWTDGMGALLGSTSWARWLRDAGFQWLIQSAGVLTLIAVLVPVLMVTTLLFTEIFAMPALIRHVGDQHYAALEKRRGGTVMGSVVNALAGIAVFAGLWIVTLPLWLTGIAGVVLPPLLSAYLAQRLFRYDALADHASAQEYRAVISGARRRLLVLGLLLAPLIYVPVVNLLAPVLGALAFTHLCLSELAQLRGSTPLTA